MVYLVMLGCSIAVYNKSHLAVEVFVDRLSFSSKKMIQIFIYIIMICFFGVLMVKGFELTLRSMSQISAATGIPVGYVVFSIPLGSFLSIMYLIMHVFMVFTRQEASTQEQIN